MVQCSSWIRAKEITAIRVNLDVKEVLCDNRIYENGDGLLFKVSSNFHHLWVGVINQRMHCIIGRLGLFLHGIFEFNVFFRWFNVLILYWFDHKEPSFFFAMFSAP
ncbi:hypothetical protein GW17_00006957 [Ensete ventricosum]|nr:hypothetical protein GW17_00006957 [Ensete ventricosum]RZR95780.1 hypothetical protein BHM03_00024646 [Ensete ventricosum]